MSEQTQEKPITAARKKAEEAKNAAAAAAAENGEQAPASAEKPRVKAKAPDTSGISLDAIDAAALLPDFMRQAAAPMRERSEQQKKMDAVAQRAYDKWVEDGRPSAWLKMPVITYFLAPEEVGAYKYLIRRAAAIVEPAEGSRGAREHIGNEFTLSDQMAQKINRPELAGKTVLAWAVIDKRQVSDKPKDDSKEESKS